MVKGDYDAKNCRNGMAKPSAGTSDCIRQCDSSGTTITQNQRNQNTEATLAAYFLQPCEMSEAPNADEMQTVGCVCVCEALAMV